MKVQVLIRLKQGVLDVQGKAVTSGLGNLGFGEVEDVRIGKLIEIDIREADKAKAKEKVQEMCEKLLANTIIENYEIRI